MSGAFRIEVSPTSRAGCKNTECKKKGIKIEKAQLRYGAFITGPDWQSWSWKHWGCVTPKQIGNLNKDIEGDPSQLDGYDELPEDFQIKVANALEQGHVDDEDWGWDIEMNREGKNGYLTLEGKRRLKAEAQALKEEAAGEGSASPSKTDTKKRPHVKDDPDAEGAAENEGPATKKIKPRTKKGPEIKNEDADGGSENDGPATQKTKSRTKKEPKIKNEYADGESENEAPVPKKTKPRIKKEPKIKNEAAEVGSENEAPVPKKTKAAIKKEKKANGDDGDGDFEQDTQPVKKGRRKAKKVKSEDEPALHVKDESSDLDALPPHVVKKTRPPRKAATAKKIKDEDSETDGLDPASELETPLGSVKLEQNLEPEAEAGEDAQKVHKGRKKASKKAVNASEYKNEVKPKAIPAAPRSNGRVTRMHPA